MGTCPLCDQHMKSLLHVETTHGDYHYWCPDCEHGWYISDLWAVISETMRYDMTGGKYGKSPEQIRETIRGTDEEV